ncbi:MAG: hypothetical protein ABEJ68_03780 [Halobacteriaceae archaeon]
MSAGPPTVDGQHTIEEIVFRGTKQTPQKDVRVFVGDVEIPTIDIIGRETPAVSVDMRTDGPAAIVKYSDIIFPSTWRDDSVYDAVEYQIRHVDAPVRIEARIPSAGEGDDYTTIHYGPIRSDVGSADDGRAMRMKVGDVSDAFRSIGYGASYNQADPQSVLEDIRDEAVENLPYIEELAIENRFPTFDNYKANHVSITYQRNRDTIVSALNELTGRVGFSWYVTYDDETQSPKLVVDDPSPSESFYWRGLGDDAAHGDSRGDDGTYVSIRENRALANISPTYKLGVWGKSDESTKAPSAGDYVGHAINPTNSFVPPKKNPSAEAPYVVVVHEGLKERALHSIETPPETNVDATTLEQATKKAKQKFIDRLGNAGGGRIRTVGHPTIRPNDSLTTSIVTDDGGHELVDPTTYGVTRATHTFPATGEYFVDCEVNISATKDDLAVETAEMRPVFGDGE